MEDEKTVDINEEKRSMEWRIVTIVALALIVVIGAFFAIRTLTENPIGGTWKNDESSMVVSFDKSTIQVEWDELDGVKDVSLDLNYTMDKANKSIDVWVENEQLNKAAESGVDASTLKSEVNVMLGTYNYSVDQNELTLTEREYGDQITFSR